MRFSGVALEHHLSLFPPDTDPLTALAGVSLLLHGVEPVAGRLTARFCTSAAEATADELATASGAASAVKAAANRVADLTMAAPQSTNGDR